MKQKIKLFLLLVFVAQLYACNKETALEENLTPIAMEKSDVNEGNVIYPQIYGITNLMNFGDFGDYECWECPGFCETMAIFNGGDVEYEIDANDVNVVTRLSGVRGAQSYLYVEVLEFLNAEIEQAYKEYDYFQIPKSGYLALQEGWHYMDAVFVKEGKYEIVPSEKEDVLYEVVIDADFEISEEQNCCLNDPSCCTPPPPNPCGFGCVLTGYQTPIDANGNPGTPQPICDCY